MFDFTPALSMTLGIILILTGLELHCIETFYLTPAVSSALGEQTGSPTAKAKLAFKRSWEAFSGKEFEVAPHPLTLPNWLGWPILCVGIVFVCHGIERIKG